MIDKGYCELSLFLSFIIFFSLYVFTIELLINVWFLHESNVFVRPPGLSGEVQTTPHSIIPPNLSLHRQIYRIKAENMKNTKKLRKMMTVKSKFLPPNG